MRHSLFFCLLAVMTFLLAACSIAGSKDNHLTSVIRRKPGSVNNTFGIR